MSKYHTDCYEQMKTITNIFPIEVELPACMLNNQNNDDDDDDDNIDDNFGSNNEYTDSRPAEISNVKTENLLGDF
jgi:hypothetical protein